MNWEWLLVVLAFAFFNDWPWLIALVGLSWVLSYGHWPSSYWVLLVELVSVFSVEFILALYTPKRRVHDTSKGVALEGAALGGSTMLWGSVFGLLLWQASLGFDAAARMHRLATTVTRRVTLRGIRVGLGLLFVILYGAGVWL